MKGKRLLLGLVLVMFLVSGAQALAREEVSLKAGPTEPNEELTLVWVETALYPKNVGRGEDLLFSAAVTSRVESVKVFFENGQEFSLVSKDKMEWSGNCKINPDSTLGVGAARFEIKGENGKTISRKLDFFVNLGKEALADTDAGAIENWPLKVVKGGSVVLVDETGKVNHRYNEVVAGEEIKGVSKKTWYEVELKDGRKGWIDASYVKEPTEDYHICAYEYYKAKDYATAVQYYQKALKIDPSYVKAHFWLAKSLWKLDKENEAFTELEKVFALDPTNEEGSILADTLASRYFTTAHYDFRIGKYEDAIQGFAKVLKLKPTSISAYMEMAESYKALGQEDKAKEVWRRILALDPENATALAALGFGGTVTVVSVAPVPAAEKMEKPKPVADNNLEDEDCVSLVKEGKTNKGTNITNALDSVMSLTRSLGTSVQEKGWSVRSDKGGYKVAFLCENDRSGTGAKANLEVFEWFVDAANQKVKPVNSNAELLMARW
ncbi:MAG: tetratricopeptide repeat protein [Candidatus Saganbacteria bacterium]|nr:tetratricopeptide repeat protein [Candidatus Saganbacteria bacterium]